jgi:uncharacterized SAM-binding protein YcdF (DUF218 family)
MPSRRRRRSVGIVLAVLAALGGLGTWAFLEAATFLEGPARPPAQADAALVLGGGFGDRERRAAELHREGLAGVFVLLGMEDAVNDRQVDYLHWRVKVLSRAGVPERAIVIDAKSSTSGHEARYAARLAKERGWKRVLVVSDPPHMRRLAIVYGRAFDGSGVDVQLVASRPQWWSAQRWWANGKSANFVVTEYIKLVHTLF